MKRILFHERSYLVSEDGIVSIERSGRILAQKTDKDGYRSVTFISGKKRSYFRVHRLVASLYLAGIEKPQVNHIDGVKDNNHYLNLEWCTASENEIHARKYLGKNNFGEKSSQRKINKEIADLIRKDMHEEKTTQTKLSEKYGISQAQIGRVIRGEVWK